MSGAAVRSRRLVPLVVLVLLAVVAAAALVVLRGSQPPPPPLAAPVDPRIPDLGMAPLSDIEIGTETSTGTVFLRFSATLVNTGTGPMLVAAYRPFPFVDAWRVVQRLDDAVGGYSERLTEATLILGGDGHDHWHIAGVEAHQLEREDGTVVAGLIKTGFCFFDNVPFDLALPGAPAAVTHQATECGVAGSTDIAMGLSVGWGDQYQWYLLDQSIDITAVPDGRYRLRAIADPADRFLELDETNNDTVVVVDLGTRDGRRTVAVIDEGG